MHRDLKFENILVDVEPVGTEGKLEYVYKLTDFGFAKVLERGKTSKNLGTPLYKAPEILKAAFD